MNFLPSKNRLIFIVEDNRLYAKALQHSLQLKLGNNAVIEIFPVAELCSDNMHRRPDAVILDHFLNSRYHDASDGLSVLSDLKAKYPGVQYIVLSSQTDLELAFRAVNATGCDYVSKNDEAFNRVFTLLRHN